MGGASCKPTLDGLAMESTKTTSESLEFIISAMLWTVLGSRYDMTPASVTSKIHFNQDLHPAANIPVHQEKRHIPSNSDPPIANPVINAFTKAVSMDIATRCRGNYSTTITLQIDSPSFVATHAFPVIATIANGLSTPAAAVLKTAGSVDVDSSSRLSGHERSSVG